MVSLILSICTFAGFALLWGAWRLWRRGGASQKVWLMVVAAMVLFANIAIWVVPDEKGQSLVKSQKQ